MDNEKLYSKYLLDEHPVTFHPTLAASLGINEAILLQKINLWLNCKPHNADGRSWIYNTYKSWQQQLPFMSERTIRRTLKNLVDKNIVIVGNFNKLKIDRTLWYSIDYEQLDKVVSQIESNEIVDCYKMEIPCVQNGQLERQLWTDVMCPKWTYQYQ